MKAMTPTEKLTELCDRWKLAPPRVKRHLGVLVAGAMRDAELAFDVVGDRISDKRDWIDAHRGEGHPRWEQRFEQMYFVDSKEHAEIGTAIDRALAIITTAHEVAA